MPISDNNIPRLCILHRFVLTAAHCPCGGSTWQALKCNKEIGEFKDSAPLTIKVILINRLDKL
jgi:hypothetical protein